MTVSLREGVKYYFADFVRKGGTPPPPFTDFFSGKEGVTDLGGTPLPPFTDFFFSKKGVTDLGGTPAPPFTDKIRKVVFDPLPNWTMSKSWECFSSNSVLSYLKNCGISYSVPPQGSDSQPNVVTESLPV